MAKRGVIRSTPVLSALLLLSTLASCGGSSQPVALSPQVAAEASVNLDDMGPSFTSFNVSDLGSTDLGASYGISRFDDSGPNPNDYVVSNYTDSRIELVDGETGAVSPLVSLSFRPSGVVALADEDIIVLDYFGGRVLRLDASSSYSQQWSQPLPLPAGGEPPLGTGFTVPRPRSVALDGSNVVVTELIDIGFIPGSPPTFGPPVGRLTRLSAGTGGVVDSVSLPGAYPAEVAVFGSNDYFIANYENPSTANGSILRVQGSSVSEFSLGGSFAGRPAGLSLRTIGNFTTLFFTQYGTPVGGTSLGPGQVWRAAFNGSTLGTPVLIEDNSTSPPNRNPMALAKRNGEFNCALANFFNRNQQEAPLQISNECGAYLSSSSATAPSQVVEQIVPGGGTSVPFRPNPFPSLVGGFSGSTQGVPNPDFFVFRERNGVLASTLTVDAVPLVSDTTYDSPTDLPQPPNKPTIPAGTPFTSYYVALDIFNDVPGERATIEFSSQILGVIVLPDTLVNSDPQTNSPGTTYSTSFRGLELDRDDPDDLAACGGSACEFITVSSDSRTLDLGFVTGNATDAIRVILAP